MKLLFYYCYGIVFRIFHLFCKVNRNKAFLFMIHDCGFYGNLRFVAEELRKHNPDMKIVVYSKKQMLSGRKNILLRFGGILRFLFGVNYQMATSGSIYLNDNFLPMAYMKFESDVRIIQVWHGAGAYKRFGLSTEKDPLVRKLVSVGNRNITLQPVTSESCRSIYSEAMGIPKERILPIGVPFLDYYFDEKRVLKAKNAFYQTYPELKDKKIILYAPTLRNSNEKNNELSWRLNRQKVLEGLGADSVLIIRYHSKGIPQIEEEWNERVISVTDYPDVHGLLCVADTLITDYSSISVEFAVLDKPIYIYGYDFSGENSYDRGAYMDLSRIPAGVATTMEELLVQLQDSDLGKKNSTYFREWNYSFIPDGHCTERLLEYVYKE